ncbi:DEAD/DEAH box helicase [Patescibacteria group bacterium]|nr:DEAD/DEAH box helicase [Patescibacteria group bacterium]
MTPIPPTGDGQASFFGLGIAPKLLEILEKLRFTTPTPIQVQAIPIALEGKDVMGIAQTGTGKTLAFGIPMIQRIAQTKGRGLVVLPTRELALQVQESLQRIGQQIGLRTVVLIGGAPMDRQIRELRQQPHIFIGTPGRINDHIEQKTLKLQDVAVAVFDEADRMLDMGFAPQIERIMRTVPKERQTMLFSATMPDQIMRLANSYMRLPIRVEIARAGTASDSVTQELFIIRREDKMRLLEKLLQEYRGTVLVFSRTKHGAKRIASAVRAMGHTSAEIHSNRTLAQRRAALEGFKLGRIRVLAATDIAARGIDVQCIELVVNFDLPEQADDYVHRIGRTGRASHRGHAISFATPDQRFEVKGIERLLRKVLPVVTVPELPPARAMPAMLEERPERSSYGRGGQGGGRSQGGGSRSYQPRTDRTDRTQPVRQGSHGFGYQKQPSSTSSRPPRRNARPNF